MAAILQSPDPAACIVPSRGQVYCAMYGAARISKVVGPGHGITGLRVDSPATVCDTFYKKKLGADGSQPATFAHEQPVPLGREEFLVLSPGSHLAADER